MALRLPVLLAWVAADALTPQTAPKRSQGGSHEWLWVAASGGRGLWGTAPAAHVSPAALRCGQREHGAGRHRPQHPPRATPAPWGDPSEPGGPGHHPPNLGFAPRVAPAPLSAAGPAPRGEGGGWQPSGRARGGSSQLRGIKGDKRGHGGGRGAAMRRRKGGSGRPRWGRGGAGVRPHLPGRAAAAPAGAGGRWGAGCGAPAQRLGSAGLGGAQLCPLWPCSLQEKRRARPRPPRRPSNTGPERAAASVPPPLPGRGCGEPAGCAGHRRPPRNSP